MDSGTWRLAVGLRGAGCAYTPPGALEASRTSPVPQIPVQTLPFGTGAGQMNLLAVWSPAAIAAGATAAINLYDGSVLDVFGQPAAFRHLLGLVVWVVSGGDAAGVTIAPGATNPNALWWGGTGPAKTIYPAGPPEIGGGAAVPVDATHNAVKFTNNGAAAVTLGLGLAGTTT